MFGFFWLKVPILLPERIDLIDVWVLLADYGSYRYLFFSVRINVLGFAIIQQNSEFPGIISSGVMTVSCDKLIRMIFHVKHSHKSRKQKSVRILLLKS